jgi:nucleoside-diphosphate-sugar epimerase
VTESYREFYKGRRVMINCRAQLSILGAGRVEYVEWPPDKKRIDIGSFYSDSTRFRERVGWTPKIDLREGLSRTLAYYRAHLPQYLEVADGRPLERR